MTASSCEDRTDEQEAADRRLQEQCFLVDYMDTFAPTGAGIAYKSFLKAGGPGSAVQFISKLVTPKNLADLMELKPHELSGLVPYIKLYKVYYPTEDSEGIEYEMKFDSYLQDADVQSMMSSRKGRGSGCGIKSFEWKLAGGNPVEADRMIEAKLVLYFQSMDDLFKTQRLEPYHLGEESESSSEPREIAFVDLIHQTNKMTGAPCGPSNVYNNKYFRIKATVGWSVPITAGGGGADTRMSRAGCTVFLTMVKHDIAVGNNGDVTLTIDYMAAPEGALSDPKADVLMADRSAVARLQGVIDGDRQAAERNRSRTSCGSDADRDAAEEAADAADERVAEAEVIMRAEKGKLYENFLNEVEKRKSIFYVDVPDDAMGSYEESYFFGLIGGDQMCNEDAAAQRGMRGRTRPSADSWASSITRSPGGNFGDLRDAIETASEPDGGEEDNAAENAEDLGDDADSNRTGVIGALFGSAVNAIAGTIGVETNLPEKANSTRVHYIYLGGIIDAALGTIVSDEDSRLSEIRTLVGPYEYMDPLTFDKRSVCLADIPIALNLFQVWFFDNCVQTQREKWLLKDFLQTLISSLVAPAMGQDCFGVCASGYRTRTNMRIVEIPLSDDKKCRITGTSAVEDFGNRTTIPMDSYERALAEYPSGDNAEGLKSGSYFFIYATGSTTNLGRPADGETRVERDAQLGIYHLLMGSDRGLVKQISFKREDAPHMTAARIQADGPGNLALRGLYNADVDMFGNSIFVPGSMVYIDPGSFSTQGGAGDVGSAANILGIGGYYLVTNVENFVEAGKFETKLDCRWQALGDGLRPDTDKYCKPITECGDVECDEEEETPQS